MRQADKRLDTAYSLLRKKEDKQKEFEKQEYMIRNLKIELYKKIKAVQEQSANAKQLATENHDLKEQVASLVHYRDEQESGPVEDAAT